MELDQICGPNFGFTVLVKATLFLWIVLQMYHSSKCPLLQSVSSTWLMIMWGKLPVMDPRITRARQKVLHAGLSMVAFFVSHRKYPTVSLLPVA
jgi:hypothetical protein